MVSGQQEIYAMVCVVINPEGKILLLKRAPDKKFFPDEWAVVGAAPLKKDDNFEEIAKRELVDELGQTGKIIKSGDEFVMQTEEILWRVYPFLAVIQDTNITLNKEHTEYKWVNKNKLEYQKLSPFMEKIITGLIKKKSPRSLV